jgi:hypothetical protein
MATFNRYDLWLSRTWTFQIFKKHHTELNRYYWSYAPIIIEAKIKAKSNQKNKKTTSIFNIPASLSSRVSPDVGGWLKDSSDFDNWVRLSALSSLLSYLEIYIRNVSCFAMDSNPLLSIGLSREIDGIKLMKSKKLPIHYPTTEQFIKGDWSTRISNYRKTFGFVPDILIRSQGDLEKMRKLRNNFAHRFGRDETTGVEKREILERLYGKNEISRLSEERLLNYLGLVESVVIGIDEHLGKRHIGEYETIHFYHQCITDSKFSLTHWGIEKPLPGKGRAKFLAETLGKLFGRHPGQEFCKNLIDYYNSQ